MLINMPFVKFTDYCTKIRRIMSTDIQFACFTWLPTVFCQATFGEHAALVAAKLEPNCDEKKLGESLSSRGFIPSNVGVPPTQNFDAADADDEFV